MTVQRSLFRIALYGLILTVSCRAYGQVSGFPAEGDYRLSGNKPFVVVRGDLNDFTGRRDSSVADFSSQEEAQQAANALNDALKGDDVYRYSYNWRKRPGDEPVPDADPIPAQGVRIEFQTPKFVDPGPAQPGAKASVLSGQKAKGKIGDASVEIEFSEDGKFVITGELEGEGKWSETESGGVYLQTDRSKLRGSIKGKTLSGLVFTKDNSRPLIEWRVDFSSSAVNPVIDSVVGLWVGGEPHVRQEWDFRNDGTGRLTSQPLIPAPDGSLSGPTTVTFKWRRVGDKLEVNAYTGDTFYTPTTLGKKVK